MMSVLGVFYQKGIDISMEYMQKLIILCTGFLKCEKRGTGCTEVHWIHFEKNSGKVDKTQEMGQKKTQVWG